MATTIADPGVGGIPRVMSRSQSSSRRMIRTQASDVDEALFSTSRPSSNTTAREGRPKFDSKAPDAVVISAADLHALKSGATIMSRDELRRQKQEQEAQRAEKSAIARARKEKILKLEEERKQRESSVGEFEHEARETRSNLVNNANRAQDEQMDDVKHMNQMMLYARCVTIRDAQLQEKRQLAREREEEEKRLNALMEVERIEALRAAEERERARQIEQKRGASIIVQQMDEREKDRIRQLELKEQESALMLARIKELERKDEEEKARKVVEGKKLLQEIVRANETQTFEKQRRKQFDMEEDRRIAAYLREKERREQEYEENQRRLKADKELEIARLRAAQEKARDQQAELDALRAKRAQEAGERKWRAQEREAAEKRAKMQEDMARAREQQRMEKELKMAEQARQERMIFERIISVQRDQEENERRKFDEEKAVRVAHRQEIQGQMAEHEAARTAARLARFEEGKQLKAKQVEEKRRLEDIKQQKLEQLIRAGVPEKYQAELTKKRF
eukprot:TRINITY_DN4278_c0_g1_i1.p1 TRINITY_DN4278_c0_g1~~TRINITY_DN4278_c0_g1_i1.p1  ORF type:complete len:528 (-),score=158.40 TRINITY_DN4278_c0_g1_i1:504-2030(-)